jgi:predicted  nucleic acid-binding Zn-ribbon protein
MEKSHGRSLERELDHLRDQLADAHSLIKKLGKIIKAKDDEIHKLRELIAKRRRFLPAMPEGNS